MKLKDEAFWAIDELKNKQLISEEDTSIIFQSWNELENNLNHLKNAFRKFNCLHCIAIKSNPHPVVLKKIVELGFGLEAASIEEIELAINSGINPSKLVFDSPVKTKNEISRCNHEFPGILVNANSIEELARMPESPNFKLGLRINPLQLTDAPEIYNVSNDESKFGVPIDEESNILESIIKYPITLIHMHIGSSLSDIENSVNAIKRVYHLIRRANIELSKRNISRQIDTFDIGGGLKPEMLIDGKKSLMTSFAELIQQRLPELININIITEFGQWVHYYTGYCMSQIEYVLNRRNRQILFIHLGADYFLRDAYVKPRNLEFHLINVSQLKSQETLKTDIAGPLCFAGDYISKEIIFKKANEGDQLLMLGTGSNTYGLWSRHCSRKIPKVIGVDFLNRSIEVLNSRTNVNF